MVFTSVYRWVGDEKGRQVHSSNLDRRVLQVNLYVYRRQIQVHNIDIY